MSVIKKEYLTVVSRPKVWDTSKGDVPDPDDPFPPDPNYPFTPPDPPPTDPDDPDLSVDPPTHVAPPPTAPPDVDQIILKSNAVAKCVLPMWFINAPQKYKKIIRVLGATVNQIQIDEDGLLTLIEVPVAPGYRVFSNIVSNSPNVMISRRSPSHNGMNATDLQTVIGKEGFVMMVNNYNSVKEFDVTMDNLNEMSFYIRTWNGYTDQRLPSYVDFICELELLLVDES